MNPLDPIADAVRPILDDRFALRERAIVDGRRVIRSSANAIRSLHRGEAEQAADLLAEAGQLLAEITASIAGQPDFLHAGFVADAAKEFAEATLTSRVFSGSDLPMPSDIGVEPIPYLHGLGETVGECRRRMLDLLRDGDLDGAERMLQNMDAIVDLLAGLDYPDGMTAGLRRTTDTARALAERSRSDLTSTVVQERLRRDLAERLDPPQ